MNIEFEVLKRNNVKHYKAKHKWISDESINYLFIPQFIPQKIIPPTVERMMEFSVFKDTSVQYMIKVDGNIVGDVGIDYDFEYLYKKVPSAWIGITIGEKEYFGTGVAKKAMEFLESEIIKKGYNRIELGVFEFNKRAIAFYEKLGYKRIATIENFTYYNGEWYADIRYEKILG